VRTSYNPQFLSLPAPSRSAWQRSLTWLLIVALVLLDVPLPAPRAQPGTAYAANGPCPICEGEPLVVNTALALDAANLAGTAGILAPFTAFDGQTITIDLGARALQVTATGRISVLAGSTVQPPQFHQAGNHGTPNLTIRSTCTVQIDEGARGLANNTFRSLAGVIETNAVGGRRATSCSPLTDP